MDLHSRSNRICLVYPDFDVFAAGSSHTPNWGVDSLIQNVTKSQLYFTLKIEVSHCQRRWHYIIYMVEPFRDNQIMFKLKVL